ncbi:MAG: hypothetical protein GY832_31010 [Chloroflexi bacterium]|nr:hypothetical protein [Chloroflexota bacterium]
MLKATYDIDISFDAEHAAEIIAAMLFSFVKRHWEEDRDPSGKWSDLKAQTWATKTTNKMLLESGKMIDSLKIYEMTPERIRVGFGTDYAPYHEYGTDIMPRRESLWLDRSEIEQLENAIAEVANDH